jgi:D-tyrosyl-tRNA(Tyr) deacylase
MKFIVSPVTSASVTVDWKTNEINSWLLIYMWVSKDDLDSWKKKADKFIDKIWKIKIIHNLETDKIESSLESTNWEILLISNFTLYGRNKKWSSIDFCHSAPFKEAQKIYDYITEKLREKYNVKTWEFGWMMTIKSENTGPLNYIFEY